MSSAEGRTGAPNEEVVVPQGEATGTTATSTGEVSQDAASQDPVSRDTEAHDPLAELRAERDKIKDQLLRTAADFDNFRKRARRDIEDAARRGKEDAVREILPVADNLERALAAAESAADSKAIIDGVRMVMKLFDDAIERIGVAKIQAIGERFDPTIHDAIQQLETADHPPGTVISELAPGYRIGDRLVRAAMVAVARAPAPTRVSARPTPDTGDATPGTEDPSTSTPASTDAKEES